MQYVPLEFEIQDICLLTRFPLETEKSLGPTANANQSNLDRPSDRCWYLCTHRWKNTRIRQLFSFSYCI